MKKIITFLLLFVGILCFSQQQQFFLVRQDSVKLQSFLKIGVSLIDNAYIGVELPIYKDFSVNLEYGIDFFGYSVRKKDGENSNNSKLHTDTPVQFVKTEFKWNYNFQKRFLKQKDIKENSSNYLALQFKYFEGKADEEPGFSLFPILFRYDDGRRPDNILLTDVHWGIQHNLGSNFTINFFIGLGFLYDLETHLGTAIQTIGVKFNYNIIKF